MMIIHVIDNRVFDSILNCTKVEIKLYKGIQKKMVIHINAYND